MVLEINLVSAQGLKVCSKSKTETYAVVWVEDSSKKLRTRTDYLGGKNPTWNDKFLFRVSSEFFNSPTAAFNVEIYTVGHHIFKDSLVGTARCLVSNLLGKMITPVNVHRPSGNFYGILNVSASLCDEGGIGVDSGMFAGSSGFGFHDLMTNTKAEVEAEEGNKSLLQKLRLVRSSPSLSTMTVPTTQLKELNEAATMRKVKSDSSLATMLRTLALFSTLPEDIQL
ncbi:OLC1v1005773C1 [Oldenlandia corymbosa var. corymbosa]|uniref:OLC1v1005773C1 n=1 Tax=Oldenlandia corymbosa var. corymbosa TaxID=529605 RepID=A0AAV1DFG8_OLDCO|nr:OLC1v1005773C1 [Oldenlandia corymbosa var. corymbosa]